MSKVATFVTKHVLTLVHYLLEMCHSNSLIKLTYVRKQNVLYVS